MEAETCEKHVEFQKCWKYMLMRIKLSMWNFENGEKTCWSGGMREN